MESRKRKYRGTKNVVGIVVVEGKNDLFSFPWNDCLMPITSEGDTALHRAVQECAYARVQSIWIVVNEYMQPIVKKTIGEYTFCMEAVTHEVRVRPNSFRDHLKRIPIFYMQVNSEDRATNDSLGFNAVRAVSNIYKIHKFSKWITPLNYYITFPYGLYNPVDAKKFRKHLTQGEDVFMEYDGKTIREGLPLGFSMNPKTWKMVYRDIWKRDTRIKFRNGKQTVKPSAERYHIRKYTLSDCFRSLNPQEKNSIVHKLDWFYELIPEQYDEFWADPKRAPILESSFKGYEGPFFLKGLDFNKEN